MNEFGSAFKRHKNQAEGDIKCFSTIKITITKRQREMSLLTDMKSICDCGKCCNYVVPAQI